MIKVFSGEDRIRATREIKAYLGDSYETIDCATLAPEDLPSIFLGASLFETERKILLRDLSLNKPVFEKLPDFLNTPHKIALLEFKLDKRSATYKTLKDKIEFKDYPLPEKANFSKVFDIYKVAKKDGQKALALLSEVKEAEDPIMFTGLLVSQALKDYSAHPGPREKRVLKELAKTDLDMKSSTISPWLLVESFLLRLATF